MLEDTGRPCAGTVQDQGERRLAAPITTSPADAFYAAFRDATDGVRFAGLREDTAELERVAAAFRAGERAACSCLVDCGWASVTAREAGQTLALAAGEWLLAERYHDHAALLEALRQAWEQV